MSSRRNSLGAYCTQWTEVPDYDSDLYEEYMNHLETCENHLELEDEVATESEQQSAPSRFPLPDWANISDLTGDSHPSAKSLSKLESNMCRAYEFSRSGKKITGLEFRASGKRLARISFSKWRFRRQPKPIVMRKPTRSVQIWESRTHVYLGVKAIGLKTNRVEELKYNQQRVKIIESLDNGKVVLTVTCDPMVNTFWEQLIGRIKEILIPVLVFFGLEQLWQKWGYLLASQWIPTGSGAATATLLFFIARTLLPGPDMPLTTIEPSESMQVAEWKDVSRNSKPVLPRAISNSIASNFPSAHPSARLRLNRNVIKQATVSAAREVKQTDRQIAAALKPDPEVDCMPTPPSTALAVTEASKSDAITFSVLKREENDVQSQGDVAMPEATVMLEEALNKDQPVVSDSQQEKGFITPIVCKKSPDSSHSTLYIRGGIIAADGKEEPLSRPITRQVSSCNATREELKPALGEILNQIEKFKNEIAAQRSKKDALAAQPDKKAQHAAQSCEDLLEF